MKKLVLLRHANAENGNYHRDIERILSIQGLDELKLIAPFLKKKLNTIDEIHFSGASRTVQTTNVFLQYFDVSETTINRVDSFYNAEYDVYQDFLKENNIKPESKTVVIVGHNSGISQFLNTIIQDQFYSLTTCTAAILVSAANSWAEINSKNTTLEGIYEPSEISNL